MPRRYLPHGAVVTRTGHPIPAFERFCRDLLNVPEWVVSTEQRTLAAAIAATAVTAVAAQATLYQVSYFARIVQPATVSSELIVTIRWTEEGVAQSYTGPAMTGNTTDTQQSQSGILVLADPDTEVTVETSYASTGAEDMAYDVQVSHEPVSRRREAA